MIHISQTFFLLSICITLNCVSTAPMPQPPLAKPLAPNPKCTAPNPGCTRSYYGTLELSQIPPCQRVHDGFMNPVAKKGFQALCMVNLICRLPLIFYLYLRHILPQRTSFTVVFITHIHRLKQYR